MPLDVPIDHDRARRPRKRISTPCSNFGATLLGTVMLSPSGVFDAGDSTTTGTFQRGMLLSCATRWVLSCASAGSTSPKWMKVSAEVSIGMVRMGWVSLLSETDHGGRHALQCARYENTQVAPYGRTRGGYSPASQAARRAASCGAFSMPTHKPSDRLENFRRRPPLRRTIKSASTRRS